MKFRNYFIALIMFAIFGGCTTGESKNQKKEVYYFKLKNFFEGEIVRLNKANPAVIKTVLINKQSETKQIKIKNWNNELSLFIESDINKAAFKNNYAKDSAATKIIYTAKNKDLKIQNITIFLQNNTPVYVHIINHQKNYLFQSSENLTYYPNKAYIIEKRQKVLFWDEEVYKVKGQFKFRGN